MNHVPLAWTPSAWLDTSKDLGFPDLNMVLGHTKQGLSYGRMIEVTAWEGQGKTSLMMAIAALAQQDGALAIWGDVENSFDPGWARQRGFFPCQKCKGTALVNGKDCAACGGPGADAQGLDLDRLVLVKPYVGNFSYLEKGRVVKEKIPRLSTAQELCGEMEAAMSLKGHSKRVLVLDSIAALLTEGESLAGIENANMRTSMDLPLFMGRLLRRWVGLAQVHNTLIILVNQLREGPKSFGDPTYAPGGNAPRFYSHVRMRCHRSKGGKLMDKGKMIGFCGIMKAIKNKCGGLEGAECGYRVKFNGPLEFVPAKDVRKLGEE